MKEADEYLRRMDRGVTRLARNALKLAWRYPFCLSAFFRIARNQRRASRIRASFRQRGLSAPAFLIVSLTRRCNLNCAGCYSRAAERFESIGGRTEELNDDRLALVIADGAKLGVSFALLAGGEPFVRSELLFRLARENPSIAFPVFTNGTLITDAAAREIALTRNLMPVISVEGRLAETDTRRGDGVYATALEAMARLRRQRVFFGVSVTVMRSNFAELIDRDFVDSLVRGGAGVLFYNEYTPIADGTESFCIDAKQRATLLRTLADFRRRFPAIFLAFPGDEDRFGGCLSSGRGFVHIAPDGSLEACPFAPFGDANVRDASLGDALQSPLLAAIRAHHAELAETSGGCALWNRRDWAESLPRADAVARTD